MNWMIDGVHGDLYRQAMKFPKLNASSDEWDVERNLKTPQPHPPHHLRHAITRVTAWFRRLAYNFRPAMNGPGS